MGYVRLEGERMRVFVPSRERSDAPLLDWGYEVIDAGLPQPANLNPVKQGGSTCLNTPHDQNLVNILTDNVKLLGLDQCSPGTTGASIFVGKGKVEFFETENCQGSDPFQTEDVTTASATIGYDRRTMSIKYYCDEAGSLKDL
ncbi:hypothetical protein HK104_004997 [Borealophlyctis nickersoniae]|nr:hypothetical protein HK104_004997 [Borealophlyctis nickersoniae]